MIKKKMRLSILTMVLSLSLVLSTTVFASPRNIRLSGASRYETSSAIASNGWTQSDYAVLTLGENFPDALSSAPLAGKYKAPILLTEKDSIPSSTLNTIQKLQVKNIFIIGGTGVVSQAVEDQLTSLGISITRLFGQNRYETDIAVAKQLGTVSQIAVVTGEDYADALSIAPIAVKLNMPIILVGKDNIPQEVKDYINSQNISKTYVIGKGTSLNNEDGLSNVTEINGSDKYARNIAVINAFKSSLDFSTFYLASGEGFADALSGSVLAGMSGNPLLLVGNDISNEKNLLQLVAPNANIKILGGTGVLPDNTINDISNSGDNTATTPSAIDTTTTTQQIAAIKITSTSLTITSNGTTQTGNVNYKVYDYYGNDITTSTLANNDLTFQSGVGTITGNNGLITITSPYIDLTSYSTLVITVKASNGVSTTMSLPMISNITGTDNLNNNIPTNIVVNLLSDTSVSVQWNKIDNVDYYNIYYSDDNRNFLSLHDKNGNKAQTLWHFGYSESIIGLPKGITLYVKITSEKNGVESGFSNTVSVNIPNSNNDTGNINNIGNTNNSNNTINSNNTTIINVPTPKPVNNDAYNKMRKQQLESELADLLTQIQNAKNNKSVQVMTQNVDGSWNYTYVADQSKVDSLQRLYDAKLAYYNTWLSSIQ